MDDQKLGYLPVDELLVCLKDVNVQIADHEKKLLLKFFDLSPHPKGTVDITEFMRGIRGKFLKSRIALLERVWREKIAPTGAQKVPIKEVIRLIDFTHDPDVFTGRLTKEQAIRDFPDLWDKNLDGFINWHEFVDFYRDISAALETEAHFEMILRNAWSFNFVETHTIKTIGRRVLVSLKNGHKKYVDFGVPEDEYLRPRRLDVHAKLFLRGVKDVLMVHDAGLAPEKHKTGATSRGIVAEQALGYGSMRAGFTCSSTEPMYVLKSFLWHREIAPRAKTADWHRQNSRRVRVLAFALFLLSAPHSLAHLARKTHLPLLPPL